MIYILLKFLIAKCLEKVNFNLIKKLKIIEQNKNLCQL